MVEKEKQITPEFYGQCARDIKEKLSVLGRRVLEQRRELLLAQAHGDFALVNYCETAVEHIEPRYYELVGLKDGLELVAGNQDPRPLIAELVSGIEKIVGEKENK